MVMLIKGVTANNGRTSKVKMSADAWTRLRKEPRGHVGQQAARPLREGS